MKNKAIIIASLIIAVSLLGSSLILANGLKSSNKISSKEATINTGEKKLLKQEEAAKYLGIEVEDFRDLITSQIVQKENLTAFSTYRFIPYVIINNEFYFTKGNIDKWLDEGALYSEYNLK
ncbi:MAG: hypothetical protein FH761_15310 [Firmicutes bacterium]|nr:hypothetical protein [Bacillota bacterium]